MLGPLDKAICLNEQGRGEREDGHEADGDALCERETKVGTDLELHSGQRDEADGHRAPAGEHRDRALAAGLHHVGSGGAGCAFELVIAVEQKDGEVERDGDLQN